MTILAIDSSAVTAGCAVCRDGDVIANRLEKSGLTHSQTLLPLIDAVLSEAELTADDIDLFAVSAGPGSFTGVRIGVSTAKGIAFTHKKTCAGVSTLDAIAYGASALEGHIASVMDARREQVYNALYRVNDGSLEKLTEDRAISIAQLETEIAVLDGDVWLCGDGAALCFDLMEKKLSNVRLAPEDIVYQSGKGVAAAAMALGKDAYVSHEKLKPYYLRLPQAERELNKKRLANT